MIYPRLFLGSQSHSRQLLLQEARIPFTVLPHSSSELDAVFKGNVASYVIQIAHDKMETLSLPQAGDVENKNIIVLTADSLVQHVGTGKLLGKPKDVQEATEMLALARAGEMLIMTGCCLREYTLDKGIWSVKREEKWATPAYIEFIVPESEVNYYLEQVPEALFSAGAGILEGFGANYLKSIRGSFSGGRGLPLFEVREILRSWGFGKE